MTTSQIKAGLTPGNLGFIASRFAGTDGVSLESDKWAEVLAQEGHPCFWYAGRLDRPAETSLCIPEAFFQHPDIDDINQQIWGITRRPPKVSRRIRELAEYLKGTLYDFVHRFDISVLIIENALTIPMHIPLGVAITELLLETDLPAIAHHHDFYWERRRYQVSAVTDYLEMAFPPRTSRLQHVVINQAAREELSWRKGIASLLIPNVLDFDHPPAPLDNYAVDVREAIGLSPDNFFILQPTRIVPRKGIEHAITLTRMLGGPQYKLIISHESGDEGYEYDTRIKELAHDEGVDLRWVGDRVSDKRLLDAKGRNIYTPGDLYNNADLVTLPSLYEGFGNAFLEAIYYRVPLLVNRYRVFARDLESKGFRLPVINDFVDRRIVEEVRHLMDDTAYREKVVEHNYRIAKQYYSYDTLRHGLMKLFSNIRHGVHGT